MDLSPAMTKLWRGAAAVLLAALCLGTPGTPRAYAVSITVTTTTDELNLDGDCSLREAVTAANSDTPVDACAAGSGLDTIHLPAGTYPLALAGGDEEAAATGDLDLTGGVTISGAGAGSTVVDGSRLDRLFDVHPGAGATLAGLTLRNGSAPDGGGLLNRGELTLAGTIVRDSQAVRFCPTPGCREPVGGSGGGIYNTGTLTLDASVVTNNRVVGCCFTAVSTANQGGGIYSTGSLRLTNSTVSDNSITNNDGPEPTSGGGIYAAGSADISGSTISGNVIGQCCGGGISNGGTMTMTDSTISGNRATFGSGGGISNDGSLSLNNVTITDNFANPNQGCGFCPGGGISNGGAVTLRNSIIAGNHNGGDEPIDCGGLPLTSQGYNLIGDPEGCTIEGDATGNQLGVDPGLGPLQDNGGPAFTHELPEGSPALDAGNPAAPGSSENACTAADQRGVLRPQDGDGEGGARCDIGAFEREGDPSIFLVTVDIKPRNRANLINLKNRHGLIPVAILTTPDFDATTVDPRSVCFGDAEDPSQRDCTDTRRWRHRVDVDRDGDRDLLLYFQTRQSGIDRGDTQACLTGQTNGGQAIEGCDRIRTLGHPRHR